MNPYQVVEEFEIFIADFCRCPYAVAVDSCTNAIFLCCKYLSVFEVTIPKKTYPSVPCSIIHAGGKVLFEDEDWEDRYQLKPYPIYDCAGLLSKGMHEKGAIQCISFTFNKPIPIGKGGMILSDDKNMVKWLKLARYMGRHECDSSEDCFEMVGWNMYMTPEQAARGLVLGQYIKEYNLAQKQEYQDLSLYSIYK